MQSKSTEKTYRYNNVDVLDTPLASIVEKIMSAQMKYPQDVSFGSIRCEQHGYHLHSADAVFPLAYAFSVTGEQRYLHSAVELANWLCARQEPEGAWIDIISGENITVRLLLSLALANKFLGNSLEQLNKQGYRDAMDRAAAWCDKNVIVHKERLDLVITLACAYILISQECALQKYEKKGETIINTIMNWSDDPGLTELQKSNSSVRRAFSMYSIIHGQHDTNICPTENVCILPLVHYAFEIALRTYLCSLVR